MPSDTFFKLAPAKRNQIMSAAIQEFAQIPYQEVKIKKLIGDMGIPIGSFYQYFVDKKDLYFYVLSLFMDRFVELAKHRDNKPSITAKERERRGVMIYPELSEDRVYKAIVKDNFNLAPLSIKRDWYFEVIMENYLHIYEKDFFNNPELARRCTDNKNEILGLFVAIRSVAEQFADYSKDYGHYREVWDLFHEIISEGVKAIKD